MTPPSSDSPLGLSPPSPRKRQEGRATAPGRLPGAGEAGSADPGDAARRPPGPSVCAQWLQQIEEMERPCSGRWLT